MLCYITNVYSMKAFTHERYFSHERVGQLSAQISISKFMDVARSLNGGKICSIGSQQNLHKSYIKLPSTKQLNSKNLY